MKDLLNPFVVQTTTREAVKNVFFCLRADNEMLFRTDFMATATEAKKLVRVAEVLRQTMPKTGESTAELLVRLCKEFRDVGLDASPGESLDLPTVLVGKSNWPSYF